MYKPASGGFIAEILVRHTHMHPMSVLNRLKPGLVGFPPTGMLCAIIFHRDFCIWIRKIQEIPRGTLRKVQPVIHVRLGQTITFEKQS